LIDIEIFGIARTIKLVYPISSEALTNCKTHPLALITQKRSKKKQRNQEKVKDRKKDEIAK
jgi:hypothetical protein